MKRHLVDLNEYYTNEEAVERLSANVGRPIDKNYPRTLVRYKKVRSIDFGARGKMYFKEDINNYYVSETRGRKPKSGTPARRPK